MIILCSSSLHHQRGFCCASCGFISPRGIFCLLVIVMCLAMVAKHPWVYLVKANVNIIISPKYTTMVASREDRNFGGILTTEHIHCHISQIL